MRGYKRNARTLVQICAATLIFYLMVYTPVSNYLTNSLTMSPLQGSRNIYGDFLGYIRSNTGEDKWLWDRESMSTYNCSRGGNPFCQVEPIPAVIHPLGLCDKPSQVDFLITINSAVRNFTQRMRIRNSWLTLKRTHPYFIVKHMFVLALPVTPEVREEARRYNDILVGDFVDHYRNLTRKTVFGFRWSLGQCPDVRYFMKMDDDTYINLDGLINSFRHEAYNAPSMVGRCYPEHFVERRPPDHKWYVSPDEYPDSIYPPYCCGNGYVLSGFVARDVAIALKWLPLISLEDMLVGLAVARLNYYVKITDFTERYDRRDFNLTSDCEDIKSGKVLTLHNVSEDQYYYFSNYCGFAISRVQGYSDVGAMRRVDSLISIFHWIMLHIILCCSIL